MSRIGIAASLLKDGMPREQVAKQTRLTLAEVDMLAREVQAASPRIDPPRQPAARIRKPLLTTERSGAIREALALDDRPARKDPSRPSRKGGARPRWTGGDDEQLRELVQYGFSHAEIAETIGRSKTSVTQRASIIGASMPGGGRSKLLSAMLKARYHLKAGDHITALDIIEESLKETKP